MEASATTVTQKMLFFLVLLNRHHHFLLLLLLRRVVAYVSKCLPEGPRVEALGRSLDDPAETARYGSGPFRAPKPPRIDHSYIRNTNRIWRPSESENLASGQASSRTRNVALLLLLLLRFFLLLLLLSSPFPSSTWCVHFVPLDREGGLRVQRLVLNFLV
jgi:hypothetical protein